MASRQVEGPARADCLLHKTVYPKQPFGSHTSLALGCSHPINRPYVIGLKARPALASTHSRKSSGRRVPRPPPHCISAPLREAPPKTAPLPLRNRAARKSSPREPERRNHL